MAESPADSPPGAERAWSGAEAAQLRETPPSALSGYRAEEGNKTPRLREQNWAPAGPNEDRGPLLSHVVGDVCVLCPLLSFPGGSFTPCN